MKIVELKTCESTNNFAADLQRKQKLPFVVRTDYQSQGRGQAQNIWISDKEKNLLFSIVFDSKSVPIEKNFFISKFIAISLLELIMQYTNEAVIKWPNDILVGTKKIAGILIENTILGNNFDKSIAGIGLNVNQLFEDTKLNATSLFELCGKEFDISSLLDEFIEIFDKKIEMLTEKKFDMINREYFAFLYKYREYHLFCQAEHQFLAKIIDIQDDGLMVLEKESGNLEKFSFGEIDFIIK